MKPGEELSQYLVLDYAPSKNKHEDSFCFNMTSDEMHLLSVFDGCGGLGARHYSRLNEKTGAFIAAQTCARIADKWVNSVTTELLAYHAGLVSRLKTEIVTELRKLEDEYADQNKLIGSMVRTMPCTASIALIHGDSEGSSLKLTTLNTGDSRVYVLTAEHGLQQLTIDDLRSNPDALMNLYVSAPLTNVVNIDKDFDVHIRTDRISCPFAVMVASDGVFGYVKTPMEFEHILLQSIIKAESFAEAESSFCKTISSITGDDATAIMAFYGWKSFDDIKSAFIKRAAAVEKICEDLHQNMTDDAIESAWNEYKRTYMFDEVANVISD